MAVELNYNTIIYQAQSKLLEIATKIADTRNTLKPEIVKLAYQGQRISDFLRALDSRVYITQIEQDQIINCLIKTAEIFEFPIAPTINFATRPDVVLGNTYNITTTVNNSAGATASNIDVDTGTETVDEFSVLLGSGAVWFYTIRNSANAIQRSGWITATWTPAGVIDYTPEDSTTDIGGVVDVSLSVDYNLGNARLRATATSDNWKVFSIRFLIPAS